MVISPEQMGLEEVIQGVRRLQFSDDQETEQYDQFALVLSVFFLQIFVRSFLSQIFVAPYGSGAQSTCLVCLMANMAPNLLLPDTLTTGMTEWAPT